MKTTLLTLCAILTGVVVAIFGAYGSLLGAGLFIGLFAYVLWEIWADMPEYN